MATPSFAGILLRVPAGQAIGLAAATRVQVGGVSFDLEPLFTSGGAGGGFGIAADEEGRSWVLARADEAALRGANPWDLVHLALVGQAGLAAAGIGADYAEPDLAQEWLYVNETAGTCTFDDQEGKNGKIPTGPEFAWHLSTKYSGLRDARQAAGDPGDGARIRIAHLDTGYPSNHAAVAPHLRKDIQRNFTGDGAIDDAHDPAAGGFSKNPGHGTGTLGILAGGPFKFKNSSYAFDDFLGGAPHADVVPVRVAKSVIQLYTSSVARGIDYAIAPLGNNANRAHVLSMSLGGLPSQVWADAVNNAYESGVVLVTAAGNHFAAGFIGALARSIVYPARFRRVIAACGVMANLQPYYGLPFGTMQGNWGPKSKMGTAMAAFTPNMPWAELGCEHLVDMDGRGTSAATPQIAAAAALYFQEHRAQLEAYSEGWMRVEAVRRALFTTADPLASGMSEEMVGNGMLRAHEALGMKPPDAHLLTKTRKDSARFGLMKVLFGWLGLDAAPGGTIAEELLALEATQVFVRGDGLDKPNPFEEIVEDPDADDIPINQQREVLELIVSRPEGEVSKALRASAARLLADRFARPGVAVPVTSAIEPPARKARETKTVREIKDVETAKRDAVVIVPAARACQVFEPPPPPFRLLRGFAVDPSLATRLATAPISVVTLPVQWEEPLAPGPCGEYVEVIDHDPASKCFYEPVDLNRKEILAQNGLPPSEGTPQFHQQMAYAVAMNTIRHFERALGRRALWRAGPPRPGANQKDDSHYVQRLRIYPHALREPNAYYSPQKIALLFGYYNAGDEDPGGHMPGSTVFSCLSHDIIAHETTHALLDGMHRRYTRASNPDVRAFHEAFADIVALFEHFTYPDILRHQISRTRGEIRSQENLLGQLAGEFGRTTGRRGALRDAIGKFDATLGRWVPHQPDPKELSQKKEPHDRGGILVAAVFDAFLSIYETRTGDLLRLATGGTGILQPGAIHPDLVNRLANEAAKSANHALAMCIRALDYCPPVDITFGEYLRAVITADMDMVPDDDLGYRVAFMEAFRRRGIYPLHVRNLSEESLRWRTAARDDLEPSLRLRAGLGRLATYAKDQPFNSGREETFFRARAMRREIHTWLQDHFTRGTAGTEDARFLGVDPSIVNRAGLPTFEVHALRLAWRESPDGGITPQILLTLLQEKKVTNPDTGEPMAVEGGCTLVGDLRTQRVSYCIRKYLNSSTRLERQREFALQAQESLAATYFGASPVDRDETEPFALIHRGG